MIARPPRTHGGRSAPLCREVPVSAEDFRFLEGGDGSRFASADHGRAELFVADFYPRLGEYLAERHASGYDAVAARARFLIWLGTHVDKSAVRPPRADPGGAGGLQAAPLLRRATSWRATR